MSTTGDTTRPAVDLPPYKHVCNVVHLSVPTKADFRVKSNWGWTVRVYDIELVDWPDGSRYVRVEGQHIRKDEQPGAHRRGGSWTAPEQLPNVLAALVEDARPGWWTGADHG